MSQTGLLSQTAADGATGTSADLSRPAKGSAYVPGEPRLTPPSLRFDLFLGFVVVAVTIALILNWHPLLAFDVWVRDFGSEHRPWWPDTIAANFERLGQGGPLAFLCFLVALFHWRRQRSVEPVLAIVSAFLISYGCIGTMKLVFDRPMPYRGAVELFAAPNQLAYPSGHASNGVLWYGMLLMLIGPFVWPWVRKGLRYAPPVIVAFTTVYLGHHWISDVIPGLAIGLLIERTIRRRLWREFPWLVKWLRLPVAPSGSEADPTPAAPTDATRPAVADRTEPSDAAEEAEPAEAPRGDKEPAEAGSSVSATVAEQPAPAGKRQLASSRQ